MEHLSVLILSLLLLSQTTKATQQEEKQWQDGNTQDSGGAEYAGGDVGTYQQGGAEYSGGDMGAYGNGFSNEYGGRINANGYADGGGSSYNSEMGGASYGEQVHNSGYGGEQMNNNGYAGEQMSNNGYGEQINTNGYGGEQVNTNGYAGEQMNTNGYGGEQMNTNGYGAGQMNTNGYGAEQLNTNGYGAEQLNNGYGGEQMHNGGYGGEQVHNGGYGGEQIHNGGYGGDVHTTTSYSGNGYDDMGGYGGVGFGGVDAYGGALSGGLSNDGWERPVKTVVKHVLKNIAVPHAVPAPVHVPVPKYVKYFKPFAIAKPVAVPHIIPVIKHIQKPIPFFTSIPVKHSVPVPKFVGLPVQVRVPRPVFIHVPKIVPVAKKYPVAVPVNIPKPYIVPVYKHVPVPVPHKVPKVINVIKEVPHYVKKPVPVYVDDHPSFSNVGNTLSSSTFSNHYGNGGGFESFNGAGYGNDGDMFGGSQGMSQQNDNSYNNAGLEYGKANAAGYTQQSYSDSQNMFIFNPFIQTRQKVQGLKEFHVMQQQKLQYPSQSYPRAHRTQNKGADQKNNNNNNAQTKYQSQGLMNYTYNASPQTPSIELDIELNQAGIGGATANYNTAMQQGGGNANYNSGLQQSGNTVSYNTAMQQDGNYNQGQASAFNDLYYQNSNVNSQVPAANDLTNAAAIKVPIENVNPQFSQPLYDPNSYAEFAMSQQSQPQPQPEYNHSYSQPFADQKPVLSQEESSQGMVAQASKAQYYNQHPENAYSVAFNSNYQNGGMNGVPPATSYETYNNEKSPYVASSNFDFANTYNGNNNFANFNQGNDYKSTNTYQSNSGYQSPWPTGSYNQNENANIMYQIQQLNQQQQKSLNQMPSQSNLYNHGGNNFNVNPTSFKNAQGNYQPAAFNNENNDFNGYVPSGSSSSSTSFSESASPSTQDFQASIAASNFLKQNEKFDQSASQNTYTSDSNIALPGMYSNIGASVSYSGSSYGNNYDPTQNYDQQSMNPVMSNIGSQLTSENQMNSHNQFSDPGPISPSMQMNSKSQFNNPRQFNSAMQMNSQSHFKNPSQFNSPSQSSAPSYLNDPSQYGSASQLNVQTQMSDSSPYNPVNQPINVQSQMSDSGPHNPINQPNMQRQMNKINNYNSLNVQNRLNAMQNKINAFQNQINAQQLQQIQNQLNDETQDKGYVQTQNNFNRQEQNAPYTNQQLTMQSTQPIHSTQSMHSTQLMHSTQSINSMQPMKPMQTMQSMKPMNGNNNNNNNNSNLEKHMPTNYPNYENSGSSTSASSSASSSSYSNSKPSNSQNHPTVSKSYNKSPEKNYLLQPKQNTPLPFKNNQNTTQSKSAANSPQGSKSTFSTSYSYSFTEKKNQPDKIYTDIPKPVKSAAEFSSKANTHKSQNAQNTQSSSKQIQYSPQIQVDESQDESKSKIDEMEKHIHSSASSIINVYTNSPQSKEGKNGQTFSFMDPAALASSQSATFFQPLDSDGNPKIQYNSDDMTVVPAPSYHDPAEPLQTSLDAYVPRRPMFESTASDQNTVYKEATSEIDEYKEAISLESSDSLPERNS